MSDDLLDAWEQAMGTTTDIAPIEPGLVDPEDAGHDTGTYSQKLVKVVTVKALYYNVRCTKCDEPFEHAVGGNQIASDGGWLSFMPGNGLVMMLQGGEGLYYQDEDPIALVLCSGCAETFLEEYNVNLRMLLQQKDAIRSLP